MLYIITNAYMIYHRISKSNGRAACPTICHFAFSTPKARSTSLRAPSCLLKKFVSFFNRMTECLHECGILRIYSICKVIAIFVFVSIHRERSIQGFSIQKIVEYWRQIKNVDVVVGTRNPKKCMSNP